MIEPMTPERAAGIVRTADRALVAMFGLPPLTVLACTYLMGTHVLSPAQISIGVGALALVTAAAMFRYLPPMGDVALARKVHATNLERRAALSANAEATPDPCRKLLAELRQAASGNAAVLAILDPAEARLAYLADAVERIDRALVVEAGFDGSAGRERLETARASRVAARDELLASLRTLNVELALVPHEAAPPEPSGLPRVLAAMAAQAEVEALDDPPRQPTRQKTLG